MNAAVASPCIKVCVVDEERQLCVGCFRTLAEIAGWGRMSAADRQRIMADLPGRQLVRTAPVDMAPS